MDKCTFWFNIAFLIFDFLSLGAVIAIAVFTWKSSQKQAEKELERFEIIIGLLSFGSSGMNSSVLAKFRKEYMPDLIKDKKLREVFAD